MISRDEAEAAMRAAVRAGEAEDALLALEALEFAERIEWLGGFERNPATHEYAAELEAQMRDRGLAP